MVPNFTFKNTLCLLFGLFCIITNPVALYAAGGLAKQLEKLAHSEKFTLRGVNHLGNAAAGKATGSPLRQLRVLLNNFDYVIVQNNSGGIQRLIIVGAKRAAPAPPVAIPQLPESSPDAVTESSPGETVIRTKRDGANHLVNAVLVGTSGQKLPIELMIDTGSSVTVLPISQASKLGFDLERLSTKKMTTVKGQLQVRVGVLPFLELGTVRVPNLEVAFVEAPEFGQRGLLGMNLLSRYIFILDDEHNELTLVNAPH